ncbi:MAG TPA: ABC transporter substrate-binding protein, partial [Terriglobales bacterium]|nr:ABC transporter substrate-binding protein [Terriglobales bacterium]
QSQPVELIAIVFANDDPKLREALALSVDRAAIFNVLLGRQGEPTAALLPNWMTGYGFVFDAGQDIQRARQLRAESRRTQPLTLTYDPQDALARAIAERVALDARGAGLAITPTTSIASPDARLVRVLLPTHDPQAALAAVAAALGASAPKNDDVPEEWYAAERRLRDDLHVVPILHVPVAYGLGARVKGWAASKSGAWALDDVWLEQRP